MYVRKFYAINLDPRPHLIYSLLCSYTSYWTKMKLVLANCTIMRLPIQLHSKSRIYRCLSDTVSYRDRESYSRPICKLQSNLNFIVLPAVFKYAIRTRNMKLTNPLQPYAYIIIQTIQIHLCLQTSNRASSAPVFIFIVRIISFIIMITMEILCCGIFHSLSSPLSTFASSYLFFSFLYFAMHYVYLFILRQFICCVSFMMLICFRSEYSRWNENKNTKFAGKR